MAEQESTGRKPGERTEQCWEPNSDKSTIPKLDCKNIPESDGPKNNYVLNWNCLGYREVKKFSFGGDEQEYSEGKISYWKKFYFAQI